MDFHQDIMIKYRKSLNIKMFEWLGETMELSILPILLGIICVMIVIVVVIYRIKNRNREILPDDLEGREFEFYCAELLENRGFLDVQVTKGSGDYGIDILAEKDGISFAIQCKRYSAPVGVKAIQEAYAGRDYYDCMVGVVLTNQYFTGPAVEAAKKLKILLWDRGYLDEMIRESHDKQNR